MLPVVRRLREHVAQIDFSVAIEDERRRCGGDDGRTAVAAVAVDGRHGWMGDGQRLVRVDFLRLSLLLVVLQWLLLLLRMLTAGMCERLVKDRVGCDGVALDGVR